MEKVNGNETVSRRKIHDECIKTFARISLEATTNSSNETVRNGELNPGLGLVDAAEIRKILNEYDGQSIIIIGTPGIGKSTVAQHLDSIIDMDAMFDKMHEGTKGYLLHHEYYTDESGQNRKRTIPFRQDPAYLNDLTTTTRQLSLYAEEFFRQYIKDRIPLIGTTPLPADKAILLKANPEDLLRNAENRSQKTTREIDYERATFIQNLIESQVYELFDENDVIVYTMQYE